MNNATATNLDRRYQDLLALVRRKTPMLPPLREIAKKVGFRSASGVQYALRKLQKLGYIRIAATRGHFTIVYLN